MPAPQSSTSDQLPAAPDVSGSRPARAWRAKVTRTALLAALLGIHFLLRWHIAQTMPLEVRHFYPRDYLPAIRMVASHRATGHLPAEIWENTPELKPLDRPEATAVRDFITLRRPTLTTDEERAFLGAPGAIVEPGCIGRVLDIYLAALVWRVAGTSWGALFIVYCLISTLACWMVASIARTLTGSFGAGLLAAALYCTSPLESECTVWSLRDTSPLWFVILSLWCLARFVLPAARPGLPHLALGVATAVGLGWRPDTLLMIPLAAAGVIASSMLNHRHLRLVVAAVALFALGAGLTRAGIRLAGPQFDIPNEAGLHVAYYGHWSRAGLLGIENSFEISRDDMAVRRAVSDYGARRGRFRSVEYLGPNYAALVREMYLQTLPYYAYRLVTGYPWSTWRALAGFSGMPEGQYLAVLDRYRYPLPWWYEHVLDPLREAMPALAVVGAFCGLRLGRSRLLAALLLGFLLYYAAILLLVLPEAKHTAPLILPTSVFAAVAVWSLTRWRSAYDAARRAIRPFDRVRVVRLVAALGGAAAIVVVACAASAAVSRSGRAGYLGEIARMSRVSVPPSAIGFSGRAFSVARVDATSSYLLTIADGDGLLTTRYLGTQETASFLTRHRLRPRPIQYFFFMFPSDGFRHATVTLKGKGTIVSAMRLDASRWTRPAFSTVFSSPDRSPGAPRLPDGVVANEFFDSDLIDDFGIPLNEGWRFKPANLAAEKREGVGEPYVRVIERLPGGGIPLAELRPVSGGRIHDEGATIMLTSAPGFGAYSAELSVQASQEAYFTFVLRYRALEGNIQLGLLAADRTRWLSVAAPEPEDDGSITQACTVKLGRRERAYLVIANASLGIADRPSRVILEQISGLVQDAGLSTGAQ